MKKINIRIKKTFLVILSISIFLSFLIAFILLHFGKFKYSFNDYVYYYELNLLNYNNYEGFSEVPTEYLTRFKFYLSILFSPIFLIFYIPIGTISSLVIIYLFKLIRIRIE